MMLKNIKTPFFILFCLFLCGFFQLGCAKQGTLTGGNKDTTPPKIVLKKSTPNMQTNFRPQRIELAFDEWIKLEDVFNQVVVSPPMNERPEVVLKGKTVVIDFPKEEQLKENATYTINFGNAVKDLTESNPASNLRFVFSTGNVIDSLIFMGRVVDAITGQPTEGVLLMLYDNLADSVVRKTKPFYFSRTDKEGWVKIENVRPDTFKVFALLDNDVNYLFNRDIEKIGFPDSNVVITPQLNSPKDSTYSSDSSKVLTIRLFDPKKRVQILSKEVEKFGIAKILFNQDAKNINYKIEGIEGYKTALSKDSLLVFYNSETPFSIITKIDSLSDTTKVRPRGRADFLKKNKLSAIDVQRNMEKNPTKPFTLLFNYPLANFDFSKITLLDTAKKTIPLSFVVDSNNAMRYRLEVAWADGVKYNLTILPDALTDMYGFKNDTIQTNISVLTKKEFGDIILTLSGLDSAKNYICQLLSASGNVEREIFVSEKSKYNGRLETLRPEQYTFKIIEDINKNGVWDTGDYDAKKQPEKVYLRQAPELRANWEQEVNIDLGNKT